jgi:hypothetical protein
MATLIATAFCPRGQKRDDRPSSGPVYTQAGANFVRKPEGAQERHDCVSMPQEKCSKELDVQASGSELIREYAETTLFA